MLKLSKVTFLNIGKLLKESARDLDKSFYEYYFEEGSSENVVKVLSRYQNDDGGFGNALESDFRLPNSSPVATSRGIRMLSELEETKEIKKMIKIAIEYLESTYDEKRNGWYALPKEVNDYPHAPWWHYDEVEGMTVIDKNWGNPSAEIVAYLYKYREYLNKLDINNLVEYAITYIDNKNKFESDFELYCYIILFDLLPNELKNKLRNRIADGISQIIEYDQEKWGEYLPRPLDFVLSPEKEKFQVKGHKIDKNLDYYVGLLEDREGNLIDPPWGDSYYQGDLKPAYNEWKGALTLEILKTLNNYNRIER